MTKQATDPAKELLNHLEHSNFLLARRRHVLDDLQYRIKELQRQVDDELQYILEMRRGRVQIHNALRDLGIIVKD